MSRKSKNSTGSGSGSGSGSAFGSASVRADTTVSDKNDKNSPTTGEGPASLVAHTTSSSGKEDKKEPASPLRNELKKEVTPPSPAKYSGAVSSKKRLFAGGKTPGAKKPPGTAKVSAALTTAKLIVTGKDSNHTSAGHRFRVTAMPSSSLSEVCGYPTTPKDCRRRLVVYFAWIASRQLTL